MKFCNSSGLKTKDDVLAIINDYINAYNALEKVGICNPIFENGNASCTDVIKEFENLKKIVNAFADKGKYNNDRIVEFQGWDFDKLFNQKLDTYEDLNKAIFNRIKFLKKALYKEVTKIEYVEKSTTKSIDKNTFFTSVIATFAIGSAFLTQAFDSIQNFISGIFVCIMALLMICYKKKFFEDIK